ncbi:MAG: FaeA/PapI family transcriptional regulator [Candidatus Thorarchaeota archaeon]
MYFLKSNSLTSSEIAKKLNLSKQDTRTYLLRLKREDKIKTLGKKGRSYIYTSKNPLETEKSPPSITTNELVEVLKEYVDLEPNFRNKIIQKIAELEAKVNALTSKKIKYLENEKLIDMQESLYDKELEEERELYDHLTSQKTMPYSNYELDWYFIILDYFQKEKDNREKIEIWKCHSLIRLMKLLNQTKNKTFVANAIVVILSLFEDIPPDTFNNRGVNLNRISVKDRKSLNANLKEEFITN